MHKYLKMRNKHHIILIYYLFITVVYFLLYETAPDALDNFRFRKWYLDANGGLDTFSISAYTDYAFYFYEHENGRLANILFPIFDVLMGRFVSSIVLSFLTFVCIILIYKIIAVNISNTFNKLFIINLIWLAVIFLLPWRDEIVVLDFLLNYILPSFLLLSYGYLLREIHVDGNKNKLLVWILLPVNFTLGFIHEGFGLPALVGSIVLLIDKRFKNIRPYVFLSALFCLAGLLMCMLSPGTLKRISLLPPVMYDFRSLLAFSLKSAVILSVILILLYNCTTVNGRKRLKTLYKKPTGVFFTATMIMSYAIALKIFTGHRLFWCGNLSAIVVLFLLFRDKLIICSSNGLKIITVIISIVILLFMSNVIYTQHCINEKYKHIAELLRERQSTLFEDVTGADKLKRLTTWGYPRYDIWKNHVHVECFNELYKQDKYLSVVPEDLDNVEQKLIPVNRIDEVLPLYQIDDNYVLDISSMTDREFDAGHEWLKEFVSEPHSFEMKLEYGTDNSDRFSFIPFYSENGRLMYWLSK